MLLNESLNTSSANKKKLMQKAGSNKKGVENDVEAPWISWSWAGMAEPLNYTEMKEGRKKCAFSPSRSETATRVKG